jgi:dihydrodipicolinate synthase/N-acetylneuraminate lyase
VPTMLTHFTDKDAIDEAATLAHLEFLVEAGVDGIFALGTTGEFFVMSLEERKRVAALVVRGAAGKTPVFVHVGANSTADTIELARHAQGIGAAGAAAVTPYFFGLSQQALMAYCKDVARAADPGFPIYIYNIPGCAVNAREMDARIATLATLLRNGRNFSYLRAALAWRGVAESWSRPPLPNISHDEAQEFSGAFSRELEAAGLGRAGGSR